jgi:hypothetical protein
VDPKLREKCKGDGYRYLKSRRSARTGGTTIGPDWAKDIAQVSPEAVELRRLSCAQILPPPLNQHPNTRRYLQWKRLTHSGRRTASNPSCSECGDQTTDEEITEYHDRFFRDGR